MEVFEGLYIFQPEYVQPLKYLRIKSLTPIQHVNQYVPLSVLVDIINCFWVNRTALLDGTVLGIVIRFKDSGSTPICLCLPTPDRPTMILSKHNRVTPNPILFFSVLLKHFILYDFDRY